ncbi:MAG: DUF1343 domain-containing protein [Flavobacteriales bacterium]|nr:DUF1343 domain-containing protein [Flavobacteriales bacterium]
MRLAMKWAMDKRLMPILFATKIAAALALPLIMLPTPSVGQEEVVVLDSAVRVQVGAERTAIYLPGLRGRRVGVITNRTGRIGNVSLVDSLLRSGVQVVRVFAPEHGFRGDLSDGETVTDGTDPLTGLPVVSLYGDSKRMDPATIDDLDVLVFDIQDVGVRFYTFISTLTYVMQAAAEAGKPLIVLDRPDPNGFFVDGPVLDPKYASFVGMHPIPLVYGMTIGEYAGMVNGEGWLEKGVRCDLTVVTCAGYDHSVRYELPVRPSPNLPDMASVYLYPALGLFEGTIVSVGRGTGQPFQCIGYPDCPIGNFTFTPRSMPGAKDPPYKGRTCRGLDLSEYGEFYTRLTPRLELFWLIGMYQHATDKDHFFNSYFDKLAGGPQLREQVQQGWDEDRIRASWKEGIDRFRRIRARYLLYPDAPRR